ncbi:MAG: FtsX-like permease family protein, partial [Anaerolineales bacterium]|nr:FtsX-like permease family protein [Anaerolineales bacterium]
VGPPLDTCLFIPLTTSRARFGDETSQMSGGSFSRERVELHEVKVKVKETDHVLAAANVLRTLVADSHKEANDVTITVPLELLREAEESKRLWNFMLGSMAGISLLVGGIGIMNIMLVSVTERTREIGIRQSVGATPADIRWQFLTEALMLSLVGGLIGVVAGVSGAWLFGASGDMRTVIVPSSILLAFGSAAAVGVFFGYFPATKAAQLDPIEALRHE